MGKVKEAEIFYNVKENYLYTGTMKEGDRVATEKEIEHWNTYGRTIQADLEAKNAENTQKYNEALNSPLQCGEYIVIADWINTYTNTYTYAKKCAEEGNIPSANIVAFNAEGKLVNIMISTLADFEPFYNTVAEEWARITDLRNQYMVEIQNATDPNNIEINYAK